jgi:sulfur relay (sulfurtransferase) DsrC/TusE family protein
MEDVYDHTMDSEFDPMDPAYESNVQESHNHRISQDEQIKAHEATLANEARRNAELEREKEELERLQYLALMEEQTRLQRERQEYIEEQSRLERERMYQIAQLELAQLEEERWRRLQILRQHQAQQQLSLPKRKAVGFADSALLYSSDRTQEEVNRMWYSKDELAVFKNERKLVVKALKRANFNIAAVERSGKYCLRGYEAYFSLDINKAMKDARTLVTSLVLTEQERQRSLSTHDNEAIRFACSSVSQWACDNALKLGENDEIDVYGAYDLECSMDYADFDDHRYEQDGHTNIDMTMENFEPLQHYQSEEDPNDDNLAERVQSALKLVQALRSGTQSSSIGM